MAGNWPSVLLWVDVWPRWLMLPSVAGPIRQALDLGQVKTAMQLRGIKRKHWAAIWEDLKVMEQAYFSPEAED